MRALGYVRRKPALETQAQEQISTEVTETPAAVVEVQPSEEFDESVEIL
jgi:hypothetical protein